VKIDRYTLRRELGKGGQGVVHLADDPKLGRQVALKVIVPAPGREAVEEAERLRRTTAAVSALDDPGICPTLDVGVDGGCAFAAMAYLDGESLADAMERRRSEARPPGPDDARQLAFCIEQAAETLDRAHRRSVVHGDVKPGNLMLTRDGRTVLLDFGSSSGTPAYLPPERIVDQSARADVQGDVFALGVTLYEALALRRPHAGATAAQLFHSIVNVEPDPIASANASVPRDLDAIVGKAMEKDRARRFRSCGELAEDLRRFRQHHPVLARRPGIGLRTLRFCQRRPAEATTLALLFALLTAAATTGVVRNTELEDLRVQAGFARQAALTAADASARALESWRQLADLQRVNDLTRRADSLWPPHPDRVVDLQAWLHDAAPVIGRLDEHAAVLATLREQALPYDESARTDNATRHAQWPHLVALTASRDAIAAQLAAPSTPHTDTVRGALAGELSRLDQEIASLRADVVVRRLWTLPTTDAQWRHDALTDLTRGIESLRLLHADVQRRIAVATSLDRATLVEPHAAWERAIASIADEQECPDYRGLRIRPQAGLVPIGRNPVTRLWEFAHFLSGSAPARGADGNIVVTPEAAIVLVLVPGGSYRMGSNRETDPWSLSSEWPERLVTLGPFFLARHETTIGQWRRIRDWAADGPRAASTDANDVLPAAGFDWSQAMATLRAVGLALPTEAQWEYAARGNTATVWWTGSDRQSLQGAANLKDQAHSARPPREEWNDGFAGIAPVGRFRANAFGLHDVYGNAWEWCRDGHDSYLAPIAPADGERIVLDARERCYRGGAWGNIAPDARSAKRYWDPPVTTYTALGVRASRPLDQP
jgi:formylglycine-generating enzyme required for sulfatase activity